MHLLRVTCHPNWAAYNPNAATDRPLAQQMQVG